MTIRRIKLRRPDECCLCLEAVPAGEEAMWDGDNKTVTCIACSNEPEGGPAPGVAGASARAKGEQLRNRQLERRRQLKEQRPIVGRLMIASAGPPRAGESWSVGAVGEEKFGAALNSMHDEGVLALHDRRIPGSKANIDHIAIAATGIWVIDAKRYNGRVATIDKGGWFRSDVRLTVGGRDRTRLVDGVHKQMAHVQAALDGTPHAGIPIRGVLCFIDSDWRLFAKPFEVRGVLVTWGKALFERIVLAGDLGPDKRAAVHRHLSHSFAPK